MKVPDFIKSALINDMLTMILQYNNSRKNL